MVKCRVVLYICTVMKTLPASHPGRAFFHLVQQSLSWDYFGGSHFQRVCHPESDWRQFPFLVVVCPVEGRYLGRIDQAGAGRIGVSPGEALLVPGGVRHTVAMPKAGVLHHAHIRYSFFGSIDILQFFAVPWLLKGRIAKEIGAVTCDFHKEMERMPAGYGTIAQAIRAQRLSGQLLDLIASNSKLRGAGAGSFLDIPRMEPVFRHMETNLSRHIGRGDLAKLASLSETRFHSVFKTVVGMSPMAYLKSVRMRKAQVLLAQSQFRISEIGEHVGYPDVFHFSKVFKNSLGISPLGYRKNLQHWLARGKP